MPDAGGGTGLLAFDPGERAQRKGLLSFGFLRDRQGRLGGGGDAKFLEETLSSGNSRSMDARLATMHMKGTKWPG